MFKMLKEIIQSYTVGININIQGPSIEIKEQMVENAIFLQSIKLVYTFTVVCHEIQQYIS